MSQFTISGTPVTDKETIAVLERIKNDDKFNTLYNGDDDFTEAELGAILDQDHPEENKINAGDKVVHGFDHKLSELVEFDLKSDPVWLPDAVSNMHFRPSDGSLDVEGGFFGK